MTTRLLHHTYAEELYAPVPERGVGAVDLYVWRVVASLPSAASQTPLPARINTYVWRMSFAPTVGVEERVVDRGGREKCIPLCFYLFNFYLKQTRSDHNLNYE